MNVCAQFHDHRKHTLHTPHAKIRPPQTRWKLLPRRCRPIPQKWTHISHTHRQNPTRHYRSYCQGVVILLLESNTHTASLPACSFTKQLLPCYVFIHVLQHFLSNMHHCATTSFVRHILSVCVCVWEREYIVSTLAWQPASMWHVHVPYVCSWSPKLRIQGCEHAEKDGRDLTIEHGYESSHNAEHQQSYFERV